MPRHCRKPSAGNIVARCTSYSPAAARAAICFPAWQRPMHCVQCWATCESRSPEAGRPLNMPTWLRSATSTSRCARGPSRRRLGTGPVSSPHIGKGDVKHRLSCASNQRTWSSGWVATPAFRWRTSPSHAAFRWCCWSRMRFRAAQSLAGSACGPNLPRVRSRWATFLASRRIACSLPARRYERLERREPTSL